MGSRRLAAAVVAAATLLGSAGAAGAADWRAAARLDRSSVDGGIAVYVAGTGPNAAGVAVVAYRITDERGYASDAAGPRTSSSDAVLVCLAYASAKWADRGCVVRPAAPVTTGVAMPETAPVRVRVPSATRRGHWLEADVVLEGHGDPRMPPAGGSWATHVPSDPAVPSSVSRWANLSVAVSREASITGTVRTSRTGAQQPSRTVLAAVLRATTTHTWAAARTDLAAATRDALPALRELASQR